MKYASLLLFTILYSTITYSQSWTSRQNYNVAAGGDGAFAFTIGSSIYVGGGIGSKQFRMYDPVTNTWSTKANVPGVSSSRAFGIGFAINGKGYVALGLDNSIAKNDLWEYDPMADVWTRKTNFPGLARDGVFVFVIGNNAYIGGGEDPFSLVQYNACYKYDPAADSWTSITTFPSSGIVYPFSFAINNYGYVSCGAESAEVTNTYEYNSVNDTWTTKSPFPGAARQAGVSFVLNDIAYCGLGMDINNFFADFYSYNPAQDTWNTSVSLPAAGRSFGVAAVSNTSAFVGLGWKFVTASTYFKDWWEFNLTTDLLSPLIQSEKFYPNPFHSTIHFQREIPSSLTIHDALGNEVLRIINPTNVDLSTLPNGVYYFTLRYERITINRKAIKVEN